MEDGFSFEIRFSRVNSEAEHHSFKGICLESIWERSQDLCLIVDCTLEEQPCLPPSRSRMEQLRPLRPLSQFLQMLWFVVKVGGFEIWEQASFDSLSCHEK